MISHPESIHSLGDIFRSWQGGNNFYGCILGGSDRIDPLLAPAALSVSADDRRGRAGGRDRNRHRPDRLLLEWLLLRGSVANCPGPFTFPAGSHAWVRQVDAGLISPTATTSLPVHPTQLYASLAGFALARLAAGVFPDVAVPPAR